jgi:hypothetical protein
MLTGYPNGSRPAGSTNINNPTSTPASNGCILNDDSTAATSDEHPPLPDAYPLAATGLETVFKIRDRS